MTREMESSTIRVVRVREQAGRLGRQPLHLGLPVPCSQPLPLLRAGTAVDTSAVHACPIGEWQEVFNFCFTKNDS